MFLLLSPSPSPLSLCYLVCRRQGSIGSQVVPDDRVCVGKGIIRKESIHNDKRGDVERFQEKHLAVMRRNCIAVKKIK
jgi:hypothetical protein